MTLLCLGPGPGTRATRRGTCRACRRMPILSGVHASFRRIFVSDPRGLIPKIGLARWPQVFHTQGIRLRPMTLFNPVFNCLTPIVVKRLKTQTDEGLTPADEAGYVVLRQPPASKLANLFRIDVLPESSPRLCGPARPCGRGKLAQFSLLQRFAVWWVAPPWPILPVPAVLLALCRLVVRKRSSDKTARVGRSRRKLTTKSQPGGSLAIH